MEFSCKNGKVHCGCFLLFSFFFYRGFLSRPFSNHRTAGERSGYICNSSLPLPPASHTLRHQPGDYCRELTSADRQQPDSNREPLVSERKSLTTGSNYASVAVFEINISSYNQKTKHHICLTYCCLHFHKTTKNEQNFSL